MTLTTRQVLLSINLAVCGVFLIAFLMNGEVARDPIRPEDLEGVARWMTDHPADWLAASALTDQALDATIPRRFELWRAAYANALYLAPYRTNARAAFVRAGLFHWYELGPDDRKRVLGVTAPLLRDRQTFLRLHKPLWELTGDFDYLRRNAPDDERSLVWLRDIAAANGRFDDYRQLRAAIDEERLETFEERKAALTPPQVLAMLPVTLTKSDEPLVRRVFEELNRRPIGAGDAASVRRVDELVAFAIRHNIGPLHGLEELIEAPSIPAVTRARLAIALGRDRQASTIELAAARLSPEWGEYHRERAAFEEARGDKALAAMHRRHADLAGVEDRSAWRGLCGKHELCQSASAVVDKPRTLAVQNAQSDEVPPYVEIYVDDARIAEGPVDDLRQFALPRGRVEIRLINPWTRNRFQRRVRLS